MSSNIDLDRYIKSLEKIAERFGWKLNPDKDLVREFAMGLLKNKERYGYAYCPCRFPIGDMEIDKKIICPCVYAKERDVEKYGRCYCGLFVTKEVYEGKAKAAEFFADRHAELLLKSSKSKFRKD